PRSAREDDRRRVRRAHGSPHRPSGAAGIQGAGLRALGNREEARGQRPAHAGGGRGARGALRDRLRARGHAPRWPRVADLPRADAAADPGRRLLGRDHRRGAGLRREDRGREGGVPRVGRPRAALRAALAPRARTVRADRAGGLRAAGPGHKRLGLPAVPPAPRLVRGPARPWRLGRLGRWVWRWWVRWRWILWRLRWRRQRRRGRWGKMVDWSRSQRKEKLE